MLKIRLARVGKKKQPSYRLVVSDSTKDLYGKSLEILGHYNPFTKVCEVDKDRVSYWVSQGAQLSPTVNNLFIDQNIISGKKVKASSGKKKKAEAESKKEEKSAEAVGEKKAETKAEAPKETGPEIKPEEKPKAETPTPAEKPTEVKSDQKTKNA